MRLPGRTIEEEEQVKERLIVKFHDALGLPHNRRARREVEALLENLGSRSEFEGITGEELFGSEEGLEELVRRAVKLDPSYHPPNFRSYYVVTVRQGLGARVLRDIQSWDLVEKAYLEPIWVKPPVMVNPPDPDDPQNKYDPLSGQQGYLDQATRGIDARYAWTIAGGDGRGLTFGDIEENWDTQHPDLVGQPIQVIGSPYGDAEHGTAVLGIVVASHNQKLGIGIAPAVQRVLCLSQYFNHRGARAKSTVVPILKAVQKMGIGDVLLIEAQTNLGARGNVPVETEPAVFDVIRLATALGIVIVESAGNGDVNLDTLVLAGISVFNRSCRDSGAIIVGAGSNVNRSRVANSCYGERVDCFAWGDNVNTISTTSEEQLYPKGGTSTAAAIVAGAALSVQGICRQKFGSLTPRQMRAVLSDAQINTPSQNPGVDRIGVMPNLKGIADSLTSGPDIYLRDFVGDVGEPHAAAHMASPDIILRTKRVDSPSGAFGDGSGSEGDLNLSEQADNSENNYIYIRIRNRGSLLAEQVVVQVFYSVPTSLSSPHLWKFIGQTMPSFVRTGDELVVLPAIEWEKWRIPTPGHYCFVAIASSLKDPGPVPPDDFRDFDNFRRFIRDRNNVAWRNFNVIENRPRSSGFVELSFVAAGAVDAPHLMGFQVRPNLPPRAGLWLEMSPDFARRINAKLHEFEQGREGCVYSDLRLRESPKVGEGTFQKETDYPLRLLVSIPEDLRQKPYDVSVHQTFEGEEVGRVTWRLVPLREE